MTAPKFNVIGWTEIEAMNALQEHGGIISDNCIDWDDVGNKVEAIAWLDVHTAEATEPDGKG